MKKETLTPQNIAQDLKKVSVFYRGVGAEKRLAFIMPATTLAVVLGVLLQSVWIALVILAFAAYHTVRYVQEYKTHKAKTRALDDALQRNEISVCEEILSHIATETVYEPHTGRRHSHATKTVTVFHFRGGRSWRVPDVSRHYAWSKDLYLSPAGLFNTSVEGDVFYFISLQDHGEIAYIYNQKFFDFRA